MTHSIPLTRDHLKILQQITYAASTDDGRPILCAVSVDVEPSRLVLSATDAYVLVRRFVVVQSPEPMEAKTVLIDAKDLRKAATVALWDKSKDPITLDLTDVGAVLVWPRGTWKLRPVEGTPIDLDKIIAGHVVSDLSAITLNPTKFDQIAKALGAWPMRNGDGLTLQFQASDKAVRATAINRYGQPYAHADDFGMAMPVRRYDR